MLAALVTLAALLHAPNALADEGTTATDAPPRRARPVAIALPRTTDLDATVRQAAARGRIVVAVATRPDCAFCAALKRDQLVHLQRRAVAAGVQVIELDATDPAPIAPARGAFAGAQTGSRVDAGTWLAARGVRAVPTVLFLGPKGELAERLVGYASPDFYNAYLEERIAHAHERLATTPR